MSAPAAITATLVDVRNIAAHKCVRLEVHVPVEQAQKVMEAFGWPTMADPVHVALARLDLSAQKPAEKPKRAFNELPLSQQAGIRSTDSSFFAFLSYRFKKVGLELEYTADAAANFIRAECGISTRAQLDIDPEAAAKWRKLDDAYVLWTRGIE